MAQIDRNRLYQHIFESAVDFAIIAMDVDGLIVEWNTGAEHILGWSSAEICGQRVDCFFTPEDRAAGRPAIEMESALDEGSANDERWHLKKDGSRFWANGELMPLLDKEGRHLGFVKILRDRTKQHEAAAAHQADAEFLRSILFSSGDCIKVLDLDGNVVFMSEGGQRVMEVSDFDAIRGCPWPSLWSGVERVSAEAAVASAKAGKVGHFQGPAETMAGTPRWWDVQVTPIFGRDGRPEKLLSISRDISAAKDAENVLEANETRWRDIFARLAEGFILGEVVRSPEGSVIDWRYLDVNPAWSELVSIPMDTAIGHTVREVFPGIEDEWIAEMAAIVDNQQPSIFTRSVGKIGRWYEGRAFPLEGDRFAVLFFEITERRAAEERLRASEEEFRTLAQAMPNQVWTATPEGMLNWFSDRVYSYTGATTEGLKGERWATVLHPDDAKNAAERWAASLASGAIYQTEFRIQNAEGAYRWHLVRAVPVLSNSGQPIRWIGTNTDIDDQKAVAQSLADLNATLEQQVEERTASQLAAEDELRQSQKMEAIGQLTGGVAHDFNNLLTVIRGSVDMLRRPDLSNDKRARYVDAIGETSDRAARLTGQLLAFARRQALTPERFDVGASLRDVLGMVTTLTGSRIVVDLDLPEEPCFIVADRSQFDTSIVNMAVNARDAMGGEGSIRMKVCPSTGIPAIRNHVPVAGDFIAVSLSDSGEGIPVATLDRIFEPFFTTKPVGTGTGLGLSQVIGFAKQSGGDVHVESRRGNGTTFTLYLPRARASRQVDAVDVAQDQQGSGDGLCVLIVEDNADVGKFARRALREMGYGTVLATNGDEALERLAEDSGRFSIVFSDVVMPGMSGLELGETVKRLYPDLPIVLASGYSHVLAQNGDHGFELLHKPYSIDQLSRVIRKTARVN